jgi:hypothetical protein
MLAAAGDCRGMTVGVGMAALATDRAAAVAVQGKDDRDVPHASGGKVAVGPHRAPGRPPGHNRSLREQFRNSDAVVGCSGRSLDNRRLRDARDVVRSCGCGGGRSVGDGDLSFQ